MPQNRAQTKLITAAMTAEGAQILEVRLRGLVI